MTTMAKLSDEDKVRVQAQRKIADKLRANVNMASTIEDVRRIAYLMRDEAFNNLKVHRYATMILEATKEYANG